MAGISPCLQTGLEMAKYRVLNFLISYPPNNHVQAGEIIDDLPPKSVKYFLAENAIELVEDGKSSKNVASVEIPEVTEETIIDEPVIEEEVSE